MQDLPAPTTIVYPGSPEQFGNVVHTALRKLYRQDTERLAQEFNLDVEQVAKMRQRNLDRLAKEAGLSSETIARLKAAHRASISTGLDFYPTTQSLVEDYSFVLDENQVGRKAIIDALLAAGEYDLDKDEKRFNLEIWPLLKFVNEKKEQLAFFLQVLSSDNLYIRRKLWRCTLAYNESFDNTATIEALPSLNYLGYTFVYFQDGYHAGRQAVNKSIGDKFSQITDFIIDFTGSEIIDVALGENKDVLKHTETEVEAGSESPPLTETPLTFTRSRNSPKSGVVEACREAAEQWLDYRKRLTVAVNYAGVDKRTFISRLCDVLDSTDEEKKARWKEKILEKGHILDCSF